MRLPLLLHLRGFPLACGSLRPKPGLLAHPLLLTLTCTLLLLTHFDLALACASLLSA